MTKNMTEMLVDSVSPVVEQRQVYKVLPVHCSCTRARLSLTHIQLGMPRQVRLAGLNVSVMALFWNRFMLVERGDYLASVLSLSPLPSEPSCPRPAAVSLIASSTLIHERACVCRLQCTLPLRNAHLKAQGGPICNALEKRTRGWSRRR